MLDIATSIQIFVLFMGEMILIYGAYKAFKDKFIREMAKRQLEISTYALEVDEKTDPELYRLGTRYATAMRMKIWNGVSDDLDKKFMAYNTDIDLRLKTHTDGLNTQLTNLKGQILEEVNNATVSELQAFIDEFKAINEKLNKKLAGQAGGQMKGLNNLDSSMEECISYEAQESNQLVSMLRRQAYGKGVKPTVRKKAKYLLERLETILPQLAQQHGDAMGQAIAGDAIYK